MSEDPDVFTLCPMPTNQVDVTWANIPLRFAYTLVSGAGSPGIWETKQPIFAMRGSKNASDGLVWDTGECQMVEESRT
jgi:hypothetical protein